MRIAIAEISQETDTFSPERSTIQDFKESTFLWGSEILEKKMGTTGLDGARSSLEEKEGIELVPLISAKAVAGGSLTDKTVRYFEKELSRLLKRAIPIDALLLSLHGATASETEDDVSGHLLHLARQILGPDMPIVVPLDHHAVITDLIAEDADLVLGHQSQPHDLFDTGYKAAEALYELLTRKPKVTKAWVKIPMIAPQDQFLTSRGAMKQWFDQARQAENEEAVLSVSLFPMQPWVDVAEGGWAVVVYTDNDPDLARSIACRLADLVWSLREEFWVSERVSPAEAVQKAVEAPEGLVILSDMGDAVYGGGPGDSTCILREMVKAVLPCPAYIPVVDPHAVQMALDNGIGPIELTVGARQDPFSQPLTLSGQVTAVCRGLQMNTERSLTDLGKTALFEVENIKIVLLEHRSYAINQPILYTHLGLSMEQAKMVVLKTGSNYQYFQPWRKALIRVDSPGTTQSNLSAFEWQKLPRPIYPLDEIADWQAEVATGGTT